MIISVILVSCAENAAGAALLLADVYLSIMTDK